MDGKADSGVRGSRRIGWSSLSGKTRAGRQRAHAEDHWFEIPATLVSQYGVIRLRERPGTDVSQILQSLRDGSYRRPFVLDDGVTRRLHFDFNSVQSEMTIGDPLELNFAYTRKMMSFLLFHPHPEHVVIVGLGGGSLTRFCYRQLPLTRVTTVEIDEDVIALSDLFRLPACGHRARLVHADAAEYFATTEEHADVVLIDGCDRWGTAPTFCEPAFYENLRLKLRRQGLLVVNLIGHDNRKGAILRSVAETFSGRYVLLDVPAGGNSLLFAFNDPDRVVDWSEVRRLAEELASRHGLDFPAFARRLQRNGLIGK